MKQYTINISQTFNVPADKVFAVLSNHDELTAVFGLPTKRIKNGTDSLNGVGSVRRLGPAPLGTHETVVKVEDNSLIEYTITKFGGPIRQHYGRQVFANTDNGGSTLNWEIKFKSIPFIGGLISKVLTNGLQGGVSKLAARL